MQESDLEAQGVQHISRKEYSEAIDCFDRAASQSDSAHLEARYLRFAARTFHMMGRNERSDEYFARAIAKDTTPYSHLDYCKHLHALGRLQESWYHHDQSRSMAQLNKRMSHRSGYIMTELDEIQRSLPPRTES